jgi:hypothetical protein
MFTRWQTVKAMKKSSYCSALSLTSALDGGWVVNASTKPFCSWEGDPVIVQEAGWATEPAWMDADNLFSTGA